MRLQPHELDALFQANPDLRMNYAAQAQKVYASQPPQPEAHYATEHQFQAALFRTLDLLAQSEPIFALAMAVVRLAGDRLAEQFGPRAVILRSGLVMALGIAGFGLAPGLWMSIPAAALVGIGCGNIYPLTMSMVGQVPGPRPERNVATLALVAFTAFLIGPPLIGTLYRD